MKRVIYIPIVLFLVGIVCFSIGYLVLSTVGAEIETVDSNAGAPSLVLDTNENPHIAYASDSGLRYAIKENDEWPVETVDPDTFIYSVCLVLDSNGSPHISYRVDGQTIHDEVRYAFKKEGSWNIEKIDNGYGTSLALDSSDNPHIIYGYAQAPPTNLGYAFKSNGAWAKEVVTTSAWRDYSIALDSSDRPHIIYGASTEEAQVVRYGFKEDGSWNEETIDSHEDIGFYVSIAVDATDNPHVCYFRYISTWPTIEGMRYAVRSNGEWDIETVDGESHGWYNSLALDSKSKPHISYGGNDGSLRYASKSDGEWALKTVDSKAEATSLALDSKDNPYIAYVIPVNTNMEVKYFLGSKVSGFLGLPASPMVAYSFFGVGAVTIVVGAVLIVRGRKKLVG